MAKIVTLKSPSDEDIYPVTDASGIRVTGNVTLQQALDGFVYADDPTSSANPDGWVTPSEIDWSAFSSVIQTGTITNQTFYTNTTGGQVKSFTFPTPFSNPPKVFFQTQIGSANTVTVDLASAPTTTGFEFLCRTARGANETGNVHWLAIAI